MNKSRHRLRIALVITVLAAVGVAPIESSAASTPPLSYVGDSSEPLKVRGSVGQVIVQGAPAAIKVRLISKRKKIVDQGITDSFGSYLFRSVRAGLGYTVSVGSGETESTLSSPVRVLAKKDHPTKSFYKSQKLVDGYQYLETRDGTLLAANVTLPGPIERGPYPTVIEYSGYDPANPEEPQPTSQIASLLGYAVVGINVRGSGCSGGAWSFFDDLQQTDGYDAVETVASQSWALHHKVGMVGISYPGISQLFVAATQPPHLAGITPLSVVGDVWADALYPGGILNTGFVVPWADDRQSDAQPAPEGGQGWAKRRVRAGDEVCADNQTLRLQTVDVRKEIDSQAYRSYQDSALISPNQLSQNIKVPVFLAGSWQDEQTGAGWPDLIPGLLGRVPLKVTMTNGTHSDSLGPDVITRWAEFLDFYVARKVPSILAMARVTATIGYAQLAGELVELPPDRFLPEENFKSALKRYESESPIRVLFDSGGGKAVGAPKAVFEAEFDKWPPRQARITNYYFGDQGTITDKKPADSGVDSFRYEPSALPATSHSSGEDDYFNAFPDYDWTPLPPDLGVGYTSEPMTKPMVLLGPVSADLWVQSSQADVDLEVALTEVRPDGQEIYLQSGWLRASRRYLNKKTSTRLQPRPTFTKADEEMLTEKKPTLVRVPISAVGHAVREGSRLRVTVQPPGGNRPRWAFSALPGSQTATVSITHSRNYPSRVVLPIVTGVKVTVDAPACPGLRGQPCREFVATTTGG